VFGEIFICQFPFTSGALSKPRPALVLFDLQQDVLICRVTSVLRSGSLDVTLGDWAQAGLARSSIARLDRIVTAEKAVLKRRLGKLSAADQAAVRAAWNQHMRL
jgi:mRNA-degrading endonuclease toxin of MazEF toxin-antitoxin module